MLTVIWLLLVLEGVIHTWMVAQKSFVTCFHCETTSSACFRVTEDHPVTSGTNIVSVLCPGTYCIPVS